MAFPVTATRDSNWIATQALSRIGAASVDNPPSAEDLTLALDRLDIVAADLMGRGIAYVPDLDMTPSAMAHQMANALALSLKPDFGDFVPSVVIPPQPAIELMMRRITSEQPSFGPAQASYF